MGRKNSITALPKPILDAVNEAIRDGRATVREIVDAIRAMGAEASWSAVQRYKATQEEELKDYKRRQQVAEVWIKEIGPTPESKMGRLIMEMIKMQAFTVLSASQDAPPDAKALMLLSQAIKNTGSYEEMVRTAVLKAREEERKLAAEAVEKAAVSAGLPAATITQFRAAILGVQTA